MFEVCLITAQNNASNPFLHPIHSTAYQKGMKSAKINTFKQTVDQGLSDRLGKSTEEKLSACLIRAHRAVVYMESRRSHG